MSFPAKYRILAFSAPISLGLDFWTKSLVVQKFGLGESIPVIKDFFNLTYVRNTGAAFGMLADADASWRGPFFIAIPFLALAVIGYVFKKIDPRDLLLSWGLSLVVSGAIGNLLDRTRLGYVVDFLDFHWHEAYHFPAFNVADTAICIGVALLMLDLVKKPDPSREAAQSSSGARR